MVKLLVGTKARNIISALILNLGLAFYTLYMADLIRSSEKSITIYFFMMLLWFLVIVVLGAIETVFAGDLLFDPYWKKEEILLQRLSREEQLARKDFKDYKLRFRLILVTVIGFNIFIYNGISNNIFDFYNKVGLKFSQLKYDNEKKQIEAIESLYHLQYPTYRQEMLQRIKETIKTTKYDSVKAWGLWYISKRGNTKDISFVHNYLTSTNPEVVGEAVGTLYSLELRAAEKEAEKRHSEGDDLELLKESVKVEYKLMSPDFKHAKAIKEACKRVDYPRECLLTVALFDGRASFQAIMNKKDNPKDYNTVMWILVNTSPGNAETRKKVEELFQKFYHSKNIEHQCLAVVGIGKLKLSEGQAMLVKDFYNHKTTNCPTISQPNRGADDYILARPDLLQVKILEAMEQIEDLSYENRKFIYDLTLDKKRLSYKARAKAIDIYNKFDALHKEKKNQ